MCSTLSVSATEVVTCLGVLMQVNVTQPTPIPPNPPSPTNAPIPLLTKAERVRDSLKNLTSDITDTLIIVPGRPLSPAAELPGDLKAVTNAILQG